MRNIFLYLLFFLIPGILCIDSARAEDGQETRSVKPTSIQVSPIRIDWEMQSGESRVGRFNIRNYANESRHVSVKVENFFVSPDSEHVNLFDGNADNPRHMFNVIDWFTVPEDFTLAPGEGRDVEFVIAVPEGQPTNGYYGTVLFETTNRNDADREDPEGAAQLGVNYRVGAIITLAVRGNEDPRVSGSLQKFTSSRMWYGSAPIILTAEALNDGNMHYRMQGEIVITRFGKKFATIVLDPEVVYPGATRTFIKDVQFGMWDFGIYDAILHLQSDHHDIAIDAEIRHIYVLPKKGIVYCVSIILGIIVFVWFVKNYVTIGIKKKQTE